MEIKLLNFTEFSIDIKLGMKDYAIIHAEKGIPLKFFLKNNDVEIAIKSGRTPSKFNEDFWNGDIDFLTMQDVDTATYEVNETTEKITDFAIDEEKTLYRAPADALIVSNAMTVGLAFTISNPVYINQSVFHLDIDENKLKGRNAPVTGA